MRSRRVLALGGAGLICGLIGLMGAITTADARMPGGSASRTGPSITPQLNPRAFKPEPGQVPPQPTGTRCVLKFVPRALAPPWPYRKRGQHGHYHHAPPGANNAGKVVMVQKLVCG